jgi:hypothetical protein
MVDKLCYLQGIVDGAGLLQPGEGKPIFNSFLNTESLGL